MNIETNRNVARRLQRRTPEQDDIFFSGWRSGASVGSAAKAAGYSRRTVYFWRARDPAFAALWRETEKAQLDDLLAPKTEARWRPNPGPQTDAYESLADVLLYGGAAGGGKTDLVVGLALTRHERSVIFRRAFVDLRAVEDRMIEILGTRDGYNGNDMVLRRDGCVVEF